MVTANYTHGEPIRQEDKKGGNDENTVMSNELARIRKEYGDANFDESQVPESGNPIDLFKVWFDQAIEMKMFEPNAMCLATANAQGRPSNRYVLLKEYDHRGFVWFTNYESRKGQQIAENPFGAITFWWGPLEKSIRIEGRIERISEKDSDEYFQVRPRGAEIGAWASNQSQPIENQAALKQKYEDTEKKFDGQEKIDRPAFWGGFRLVPDMVEFWKGRRSRFHDRIVFNCDDKGTWTHNRLQP